MIEILGLAVRVIITVLVETIGYWDIPGLSRYRDYLDTIPSGRTPLSKREWKAAGKPERHTSAEGSAMKAQGRP